jgi:hypothetical protein
VQYNRLELPAGAGQLIVLYVNQDVSAPIDVGTLGNEVAADAAARLADGWRLNSIASIPMREMGTPANVLFQSGGAYVTQTALVAVYLRQEAT